MERIIRTTGIALGMVLLLLLAAACGSGEYYPTPTAVPVSQSQPTTVPQAPPIPVATPIPSTTPMPPSQSQETTDSYRQVNTYTVHEAPPISSPAGEGITTCQCTAGSRGLCAGGFQQHRRFRHR